MEIDTPVPQKPQKKVCVQKTWKKFGWKPTTHAERMKKANFQDIFHKG